MTQEQRVQLRDDLLAVRERMSDPDRVVLDPDSLFEDAAGEPRYWGGGDEPARACLIGACLLAAGRHGYERERPLLDLLEVKCAEVTEDHHSNLTEALRSGTWQEVVDAAIAEAEQALSLSVTS